MWISSNLIFLAFLYFLQGLPYGLQSRFLPIYLRSHGMSLSIVSFFKILLIPWMCKAFWAPFVDRYGTKRTWLAYSMTGLVAVCLMGSLTSPEFLVQLACVLFFFNLLTATQDIAVDGLAIQIMSSSELAHGNIAQVVGYKIGAVCSGGLLVWLSEYMSWSVLFVGLACVYAVSTGLVLHVVPGDPSHRGTSSETFDQKEDENHSRQDLHWIVSHFRQVLDTDGTKWIMVFVVLYKLGEQGALNMAPLFLVDRQVPPPSVGFWTGIVGQTVSICGSVLGGWLLSFYGYSAIGVLRLFCQLRIIWLCLQWLVVIICPSHSIPSSLYVLSVSSMCLMLLGSGIITTATFTLMMHCSQKAPSTVQASHYTTLATLEVLGKLTFSVLIGPITDIIGYTWIFIIFIFLSLSLLPLFSRCPKVLLELMAAEEKNT